jgi:ABC-type uncharacterized transport system involved in gliding motility auxiliary subunit
VIGHIASIGGFEYQLASLAYKMVQSQRKTVGFLTGHGEKSTANELGFLSNVLGRQYDVKEIEATEDKPPDLSDVDVLIIPGPTQEVPDSTREALHAYIGGGGNAMILVDTVLIDDQLQAIANQNSFVDFLSRYGLTVGDDLVFDLESNEVLPFRAGFREVFLPYPYWMKVPVLDKKVAGDVETVMLPWASSLGIIEAELEDVDVIRLFETTPFASIDFNYRSLGPDAEVFGEVTQQNLVQSLMGVAIDASTNGGAYRLVVVGDSEWITNVVANRAQGNLFLATNLVDWLAQEDALAAVRSKIVTSRQLLFPSTARKNLVQYANILGLPLVFILIGLWRYVRRRSLSLREYRRAG